MWRGKVRLRKAVPYNNDNEVTRKSDRIDCLALITYQYKILYLNKLTINLGVLGSSSDIIWITSSFTA